MQARRTLAIVGSAVVALTATVPGIATTASHHATSAQPTHHPPTFVGTRNALTWPFGAHSIWNTPIGSNAKYKDAHFKPATYDNAGVDENVLVLEPKAPQQVINATTAGWDETKSRCGSAITDVVMYQHVPIPHDFVTKGKGIGSTPNASAAILLADGHTVIQSQPFDRCEAGGLAVTQYNYPGTDLFSPEGIQGAHGGSGMSSLGGTVRLGELRPGAVIHHAMEINVWGHAYLAKCSLTGGDSYRWPAIKDDHAACDPDGYGGNDPGMVQGTLLALPPSFAVASLRSEPARILATAFKNYGAYIVDDSAGSHYNVETEWSPRGRVIDEVKTSYGVTMGTHVGTKVNHATAVFNDDMNRVFVAMRYVANNGPHAVGGGGSPRQPLAPPFCRGNRVGCLPYHR